MMMAVALLMSSSPVASWPSIPGHFFLVDNVRLELLYDLEHAEFGIDLGGNQT